MELPVRSQNIMMRWLQNTKNGGLGRGYSTIKEQVANYTGLLPLRKGQWSGSRAPVHE